MRLEGRRAVVVGVGSTIGVGCAEILVRHGADVLLVDPDQAVLDRVTRELEGRGPSIASIRAELGTDAAAAAVAGRCSEIWPHVDILVLTAALVDDWQPWTEADTLDRWEEVIRINLLGPVAYTRALRSHLGASGRGSVVYLGSIDGLRGNPTIPAYSVSRGGLVTLTHVTAHALGSDGTRVNCVATGAIHPDRSDARARAMPRTDDGLLVEFTPLARRATVDDVAAVVLFLASDDASYVTGTVLPVDGGRIAITPPTGVRRPRPELDAGRVDH
jgi:NAD(P)-dependent dehydrogenase (short-subunit alcohol dehydrogenase family)